MITWWQELDWSRSGALLIIVAFVLYFIWWFAVRPVWRNHKRRQRRASLFIDRTYVDPAHSNGQFHVPSSMTDRHKGI
jgi:hypothetical protein